MINEDHVDISSDPYNAIITLQQVDGLISLYKDSIGEQPKSIRATEAQHDQLFNLQPDYKNVPIVVV